MGAPFLFASQKIRVSLLPVIGKPAKQVVVTADTRAKAIRDAGIGGLLEKVRYKADWYGTRIIEASQWFPSSKTCSDCGTLNPDLDRQPKWACPACGVIHDRNVNGAGNLRKLALGAVSADVTLPDGKALARRLTAGETVPVDGRPKQSAMESEPLLTIWTPP